MTHVTHQIQAYLDGELTPSLAGEFRAHIRDCAACRRELDAARGLWELVDGSQAPAPRSNVWPAIESRLERRRGRRSWTWPQRGLATAALALGVVLGLQLDMSRSTVETGTTVASSDIDYLEESLPSLDLMWLQVGDTDEDAGS